MVRTISPGRLLAPSLNSPPPRIGPRSRRVQPCFRQRERRKSGRARSGPSLPEAAVREVEPSQAQDTSSNRISRGTRVRRNCSTLPQGDYLDRIFKYGHPDSQRQIGAVVYHAFRLFRHLQAVHFAAIPRHARGPPQSSRTAPGVRKSILTALADAVSITVTSVSLQDVQLH